MNADALRAQALGQELDWLQAWITAALEAYFQDAPLAGPPPPTLAADGPYAQWLARWGLDDDARLVLALALAPHLRPAALDALLLQNSQLNQPFTAFGGHVSSQRRGFWPSAETAVFLLAGDDMARRLHAQQLFDADAPLRCHGVLDGPPPSDRSQPGAWLDMPLRVSDEALSLLLRDRPHQPQHSADFPAQRLVTGLEWVDLVLPASVRAEVEDLLAWVQHRHTLLDDWGLSRRIKAGYRCLFYGPPGSGKTLTATLLGKATGLPVYRVDLSQVVSKYIGETEKNLSRLFDQAQRQDWILFFDEADALFGKRSSASSANDRYANQEVAYLLQRIEDFPGIAILASNLKDNIDEAFARRFQSMLYFPLPGPDERLQLWRDGLAALPCPLAGDCDLPRLASEAALSGGSISNVLRYAALQAVRRQPAEITLNDLTRGIAREVRKDGRI
ncbi:ATP-binding protein [Rivihabitans pingtungensis]|uniref:ATPase family protein associated with various cellular activities (AAA) n=1 Tax=Rivihabitans pingtungensis TaxID=1054498 RepID=A0A318KTV2_9NEIS|nr:ATP-binding protein [Rivihabitans pingtungensis]PXX76122.1 ATPase family protein associated with various cellular activities (AAA) [Rivihabitans pingtungensis]